MRAAIVAELALLPTEPPLLQFAVNNPFTMSAASTQVVLVVIIIALPVLVVLERRTYGTIGSGSSTASWTEELHSPASDASTVLVSFKEAISSASAGLSEADQ
jgi:hypothetical protein